MKINDEYISWYESADDDTRGSVYNHAMLTMSSMKFTDRLKIAAEILLGKRFCIWVSRNQ